MLGMSVSSSDGPIYGGVGKWGESWELILLVLLREKGIGIMVSAAGSSSAPSGYGLKLLCW